MSSSSLKAVFIDLAERGRMPDWVIRTGIRQLCRQRLRDTVRASASEQRDANEQFSQQMRSGPIAPVPEAANEQHYEVPAAFFGLALGERRKYSGAFWPEGCDSLDQAEREALAITCERAGLENSMDILELGCGWGSLTLWMAEHYPEASITAVSNSASQKAFIDAQAADRGLSNVRVITADMNDFDTPQRFDRVVSVEMFEHMRNYERLLHRVAGWLRPDGKLFVHVFAHGSAAYAFEPKGDDDWMAKHFFTGGIMPSSGLFEHFAADLAVERQWIWDGTHYQKTAEAWLKNIDTRRDRVVKVLARDHGEAEAERMYHRWRIFFLACAETFGYKGGREWNVTHTLLAPASVASPASDAARIEA